MRNNLKRYIAVSLCIILCLNVILTLNGTITVINAEKALDNEENRGDLSQGESLTDELMDLPLREQFNYGGITDVPPEYYDSNKYPYYLDILNEYKSRGYKAPNSTQKIVIEPAQIKLDNNATPKFEKNFYGRSADAFVWTDENEWVEWNFEISLPGLYQIELEYFMSDNDNIPAVRKMEVDNKIPFFEAENITFRKLWVDEGEPFVNTLGDEMRPSQVEIKRWQCEPLTDAYGFYEEPFTFYFEPGVHSIRMSYVEADIVIGNLIIKPYVEIPAYNELKSIYAEKGYKNGTETIMFQAETEVIEKNDSIIRRETDGDPTCQPKSSVYKKLNVLGGWRWRKGDQSVTWEFDVPEDGLYKIGIRVKHNWNDGLPTYRQIKIDGNVPCKELLQYKFHYDLNWYTEVLKDKDGEEMLFYLTKGTHTLTMTTKVGDLVKTIHSINQDAVLLSKIIRDITKITGSEPDPNYDYKLMETIPDLEDNLKKLVEGMQVKHDEIAKITDKLPAMANNFISIKSQLENMIKRPDRIARGLNDLNNALGSLGTWYQSLQNQPILVDYIVVSGPDDKIPNPRANVFQKMKVTITNILLSYVKNYDTVGGLIKDSEDIEVKLDVWISRGMEWAEILKEMADEKFTPETGILINMNVLPASQLNAGAVNALMLSIASGKAPDVAMGVDSASPVEFAIRDAVLDMSQFPDFEEVQKRFISEIMIPYHYRGGVYALPETMDFKVMFYRKDIIDELGISLPETREDLYNYTLPVLYQNGLQFYYPVDFTQFIYQHGATYYTEDGLKSNLGTPEAYRAFKECAELYTNYSIPVSANFFNRFRTGEMPIGIGSFTLYTQLMVAAPELKGKWGIAPLPGRRMDDGTINRSHGGIAGQCDIILQQTDNPEAAWEFLKWWTSDEIQSTYAAELEGLIGVDARWNSANINAFRSIAWGKEDLEIIQSQWKWIREVPVVLGGYFSSRHLSNAWNRVVVSPTGMTLRDSLEKAVKDIDRELLTKQEEYGIYKEQQQK